MTKIAKLDATRPQRFHSWLDCHEEFVGSVLGFFGGVACLFLTIFLIVNSILSIGPNNGDEPHHLAEWIIPPLYIIAYAWFWIWFLRSYRTSPGIFDSSDNRFEYTSVRDTRAWMKELAELDKGGNLLSAGELLYSDLRVLLKEEVHQAQQDDVKKRIEMLSALVHEAKQQAQVRKLRAVGDLALTNAWEVLEGSKHARKELGTSL